jgi:hypothetical protein
MVGSSRGEEVGEMEPSAVIGVDLGVTAPSEVAVARGTVIESGRRVASTPKGLTDGLRAAAKGRPVAVVVESTAMAWFVACRVQQLSPSCRDCLVFADQTTEALRALHGRDAVARQRRRPWFGSGQTQGSMGPGSVVVPHIFGEHRIQMPSRKDQHVVEALCPYGPHPAFCVGISPAGERASG